MTLYATPTAAGTQAQAASPAATLPPQPPGSLAPSSPTISTPSTPAPSGTPDSAPASPPPTATPTPAAPSATPTSPPTPAATPTATPSLSAPASNPSLSVDILNFIFPNPDITVGTTVTWTNQDFAIHNVLEERGGFSSPFLSNGQSYSFTFTTPGTFHYLCSFHQNMVGTVTVH